MRRLFTFFIISVLVLGAAACGDDDAGGETTTGADATTATTGDGDTGGETADAGDEADATTDGSDTGAPTGDGVAVELSEFVIDTGTELSAGTVTFDVTNTGDFPHELGVALADSYESLPTIANGAIDEEAAADVILGKTALLAAGESATIDFDLEPGTYLFFCNVNAGPNSHAANGQVLTVTVS